MGPGEHNTKVALRAVIACVVVAMLLHMYGRWSGAHMLELIAAVLAVAVGAAIWVLVSLQRDDKQVDEEHSADEEADAPICPVCMAPVAEGAYFCGECQAPISSHATLDPLKQVYSTGWMYRKALRGRVSVVVLIGMWLIFFPGLLLSFVFVHGLIYEKNSAEEAVSALVQAGLIIIAAIILCRITYRFFRPVQILPGACRECGYDLKGVAKPRCPECGAEVPPYLLDEDEAGEDGGLANDDTEPVV